MYITLNSSGRLEHLHLHLHLQAHTRTHYALSKRKLSYVTRISRVTLPSYLRQGLHLCTLQKWLIYKHGPVWFYYLRALYVIVKGNELTDLVGLLSSSGQRWLHVSPNSSNWNHSFRRTCRHRIKNKNKTRELFYYCYTINCWWMARRVGLSGTAEKV